MFENTVEQLKNQGLITQNDIVVACRDASKTASAQFWGGAIGAAIAQSNAERYILAADERSVRLFDVDKKTGNYLGTCSQIMKDEIIKGRAGSLFGTYTFVIKTQAERFSFQATKKFHNFLQKEALASLKTFFKATFK